MSPLAALMARFSRDPIDLGLDRMRAALALADHPDRDLRVVLVAGTNGKGTTASLLTHLLTRHGLQVGLFTSPHLVGVRERFRFNGQLMPRAAVERVALAALATFSDLGADAPELLPAGQEAAAGLGWAPVTSSTPRLTFFELTALIALELFRQAGAEVAVLEVGLGGRLDATNAAEPALTLITPIALDHQAWLGDTLAEIALEKAGTLRPGRLALVAPGAAEAVEAILGRAEAIGAQARVVAPPPNDALPAWLRGKFAVNAGLALEAARLLGAPSEVAALEGMRWPGRRERVWLGEGALEGWWWLDGAHNPAGAAALVEALEALPEPERPRVAVIGVMEGKEAAAMGARLRPLGLDLVVTCAPPGWPCRGRPMTPRALADALRGAGLAVRAEREVLAEALAEARGVAGGPASPVLVCGSLYLMGAALDQLGAGDAFFALSAGEGLSRSGG